MRKSYRQFALRVLIPAIGLILVVGTAFRQDMPRWLSDALILLELGLVIIVGTILIVGSWSSR